MYGLETCLCSFVLTCPEHECTINVLSLYLKDEKEKYNPAGNVKPYPTLMTGARAQWQFLDTSNVVVPELMVVFAFNIMRSVGGNSVIYFFTLPQSFLRSDALC